ncbi:colossin A [Cavenderia fasciculata]|uniref:Colossin A n=1 Tax=Cavenderia fasciculata TaxID=261658 RepID=F4PXX1_CACFS|nr:colossin A [Cavenderia fasciculata]EGG19631.1 colossin A [Cavenderia fasciculata]|eukprot:XP_004357925.1 colossin A [Cavenderia fasciculata]
MACKGECKGIRLFYSLLGIHECPAYTGPNCTDVPTLPPKSYAIGRYVFIDSNRDGVQQTTETGAASVPVVLYNQNDMTKVVASTSTDANGAYQFDQLPPGAYCVHFGPLSAGYKFSPLGVDAAGNQCFNLTATAVPSVPSDHVKASDVNNNINQGIYPPPYAIGETVFYDANHNGVKDTNEMPAAGVKVSLLDKDGVLVNTTTTDASGQYSFIGLDKGDYRVQFTPPQGFTFSPQGGQSRPDSSGVAVVPLNPTTTHYDAGRDAFIDDTVDAGLVPPGYAVGDSVWLDSNRDGIKDPSETPIADVGVHLTSADGAVDLMAKTSDAGIYHFDNLKPGDYCVQFQLVGDVSPTGHDSVIDETGKYCFKLDNSTARPSTPADNVASFWIRDNVDAGFMPTQYAVGDTVWLDSNRDGVYDLVGEKGLAGIPVTLTLSDGKTMNTVTDASGHYVFNSLPAGNYCVDVTLPTGHLASPAGHDSMIDSAGHYCFTLDKDSTVTTPLPFSPSAQATRNNPNVDAGISPPLFSVGEKVWRDTNRDGVKDPNEPPLPGVTVTLTGDGGIVFTFTTDEKGTYSFDKLEPGHYCIKFVSPDSSLSPSPSGKDSVIDKNGEYCFDLNTNTTTPVVGNPNAQYTNDKVNAGFVPPTFAIGQFVWEDVDRDGVRDANEHLVANIPVTLTNADGSKEIASTVTDASGDYSIIGLEAGDYCIKFTTPSDYASSPLGGDSVIDKDGHYCFSLNTSNTTPSQDDKSVYVNNNVNAGIMPPQYSVGRYVWIDSNRDGVHDTLESPAPGIPVQLVKPDGTVLASNITDDNGLYVFDQLPAGEYCVHFKIPSDNTASPLGQDSKIDSTPEDFTVSPTGHDSVPDKEGNICFTLDQTTAKLAMDNQSNPFYELNTMNAGFMPPQFAIGNNVWNDVNRDGIYDATEEPMTNIPITLTTPNGTVVATTATNSQGHYNIDELAPGNYCIAFAIPSDFTASPSGKDSIIDKDGKHCFTLDKSTTRLSTPDDYVAARFVDLDIDAGMMPPQFAVGDMVWDDFNRDGVHDASEQPIKDITVTLYKEKVGGDIAGATSTDPSGRYVFDGLNPGKYCLSFAIPSDAKASPTGHDSVIEQDGNTCFDLDSTTTTPSTPADNVSSYYKNFDQDAGIMPPQFAVGDLVWLDLNQDGIHGAQELPSTNTTIQLTQPDGTVVSTTTTDNTGQYVFDHLAPGNYCIQLVFPSDYRVSPLGHDSVMDSTGKHCFTLDKTTTTPTTPADNVDAFYKNFDQDGGLMPPRIAIGDQVWLDSNRDGIFDANEKPIFNMTVALLIPESNLTAVTFTDKDGRYVFDNLVPGHFCVIFGLPADTKPSPLGHDSVIDSSNQYCLNLDESNAELATPADNITAFYKNFKVDAGVMPPQFAVGDLVWLDLNEDGVHDATELPSVNTTIQLTQPDGTVIKSTTTDNTGHYVFDDLDSGDYCIQVVYPADYSVSPIGHDSVVDGTGKHCFTLDKTTTVPTTSADTGVDAFYKNFDQDAGLTPPRIAIGDQVWLDSNRDGIRDPDEKPIANMTVALLVPASNLTAVTYTDKDGRYVFDNLVPGHFCIIFGLPADSLPSPTGHDSVIDSTGQFCLNLDESNSVPATPADKIRAFYRNFDVDAGVMPPQFAVGDQVWNDVDRDGVRDRDELPMAGIPVTLTDPSGAEIKTATTDAEGRYWFDTLDAGEYCVKVGIPTDFSASPAVQDSTIDKDGKHCFTLDKSSSIPSVPADNITAFYRDFDVDAGLMPPQFAVGRFVWGDTSRDGIFNPDQGEMPLEGITVELTLPDGTSITSDTTDQNGQYMFDHLNPGNYCIKVDVPADSIVSPLGHLSVIDEKGKHCFTLDKSTATPSTPDDNVQAFYRNFDENAGIMPPVFTVGDFVWLDKSRDGIHDPSEEGVGDDISVTLTNPDIGLEKTIETDKNGMYNFDMLAPGHYCLHFAIPLYFTASPMGKDSVISASGSNCFTLDKNSSVLSTDANGKPYYAKLDQDAGIMPPLYALGRYVWLDNSRDGVHDDTELPLANIPVTLVDTLNATNTHSTVTDDKGFYRFDLLLSSDYCITFNVSSYLALGYEISPLGEDSVVDPDDQVTCFTLDSSSTTPSEVEDNVQAAYVSNDFNLGIMPPQFAIGNYVWYDQSREGIHDSTELPVPEFPLKLVKNDANKTLVGETMTDPTGKYVFDALDAGNYCLEFAVPKGYLISPAGHDSIDTSKDPIIGSHCFTLGMSEPGVSSSTPADDLEAFYKDFNYNIGLMPPQFAFGHYVFEDSNRDGLRDGEKPLKGVQVTATGPGGVSLSAFTNEQGHYSFDNLLPGNYCVHFGIITSYSASPVAKGSVIDANGDYCFKLDTDTSVKEELDDSQGSDENIQAYYRNLSVNAGMMPPQFAAGNYVWSDLNRDGKHDSVEPPIAGVQVTLHKSSIDGDVVGSVATDSQGTYVFDNLYPGKYCLHFDVPADSRVSPTGQDSSIDASGNSCFTLDKDTSTPPLPLDLLIAIPSVPEDNVQAYYKNFGQDAGIMPPQFAVGDNIWNDVNRDGIHDATEQPIANITVTLTQPDGTTIQSTTTDDKGNYVFDKLNTGNYCVQVSIPSDFTASPSGKDSSIDETGKHCFTLDKTTTTPSTSADGVDAFYKNFNVDAGLMPPQFAVGDFVWNDFNRDGVHDASEQPLANIDVRLTQISDAGHKVTSVQTDSTGHYLFDELEPGYYCVHFTIPDDSKASPMGKDSVIDATGDHCFTLNSTTTIPSVSADNVKAFYKNLDEDAGIMPPQFAVGDNVWNDFNRDGVKDPTEEPMKNISVTLTQPDGTPITSTTTDDKGHYVFDNLNDGDYCVQVSIPSDFTASPTGKDSLIDSTGKHCFTLDKDTTTPSTSADGVQAFYKNLNEDAGLMPPQFAVGDMVWDDFNRDGAHDATEQPLANITVKLSLDSPDAGFISTQTDSTGHYIFDGLNPGKYCIHFDIPADSKASPMGKDSVIDATGDHCFTLDKTTSIASVPADNVKAFYKNLKEDAGIMPPQFAVGDQVWNDFNRDGVHDASEQPLANITVKLSIDSPDSGFISTTTDKDGHYIFDNLNPGQYCLHFDIPADAKASPTGKDSVIDATGDHCFTLDKTTTTPSVPSDNVESFYKNLDKDAGILPPQFAVGRSIWLDLDRDGVRDADEIPALNISVALQSPTGETISTTIVDDKGQYLFDSLNPGNYCVQFTIPPSYDASPIGHDSVIDKQGKHCFTLDKSTSEPSTTADGILASYKKYDENAGITPPLFAIGDQVWLDSNRDGVHDASEQPLAGIPVTLHCIATGKDLQATTDFNGLYLFDELPPSNYCIHFEIPIDHSASPTGKDSVIDATGDHCFIVDVSTSQLSTPDDNVNAFYEKLEIDAGIMPPQFAVGNNVWNDFNRDGVKDATEQPIANVSVTLTKDDADHTLVSSISTDATGTYVFDQLNPGKYCVHFDIPADSKASPTGKDSVIDATGDHCFTLDKTTSIPSTPADKVNAYYNKFDEDAGIMPPQFAVGDNVWDDVNRDGVNDPTEEPMKNITVTLTKPDGTPITSTTTDDKGHYVFDNLNDGDYCVQVSIPSDFTASPTGKDSLIDSTGKHCFTLDKTTTTPSTSADGVQAFYKNLNEDAGLMPPQFAVGDFVWGDFNRDGVHDASELPLANIDVRLTQISDAGHKVRSLQTDSTGHYLFDELEPGYYCVHFTIPDDSKASPMGKDSVIDEDGDHCFTLNSTTTIPSVPADNVKAFYKNLDEDAGIMPPQFAVGNTVWNDVNRDGVKDPTEERLPNIPVTLTTPEGTPINTTTTDEKGNYVFDKLPPGNYCIQIGIPSDFTASPSGKDSMIDETGKHCFTLDKDTTTTPSTSADGVEAFYKNFNENAGLMPPQFAVGDMVWNDSNRDGVHDASELPIANITVTLSHSTEMGTMSTSTQTDSTGHYIFDELSPGDYCVHFDIPADSKASPTGKDSVIDATGDHCFTLNKTTTTPSVPADNVKAFYKNLKEDAGIMPPQFAVGDNVWNDFNRDGVHDGFEDPIANITVTLTQPDGTPVTSTTTDNDGHYIFDQLPPGNYCVQVSIPSDFTASPTGQDSLIGSTGKHCFTLDKSTTTPSTSDDGVQAFYMNLDEDAGLMPPQFAVGDTAWIDTNRDGVHDASELPLANITVRLMKMPQEQVDEDNTSSLSSEENKSNHTVSGGSTASSKFPIVVTTDKDGHYLFDELDPGYYCLHFTIPADYKASPMGKDSVIDATGDHCFYVNKTNTVPSVPADNVKAFYKNLDLDAGIMPPQFAVGNTVWNDVNRDGVKDPTEERLPNIPVTLTTPEGTPVNTTTTDEKGNYVFDKLPPGNYCIQIGIPSDFTASPAGKDSMIDETGKHCFTLDKTTTTPSTSADGVEAFYKNFNENAGLMPPQFAVGDQVWDDFNRDGVHDASEQPISNLTVTLHKEVDGKDVVVGTAQTDKDGHYLFDELNPGKYCVHFDIPSDSTASPTGKDSVIDREGDHCFDLNKTTTTPSTPADNVKAYYKNLDEDAGIMPPQFAVGDTVWNDLNRDGVNDPTEQPIEGINVSLSTKDGTPVASATTDKDGQYIFDQLPPGDYCIQVGIPTGFAASPSGFDSVVDSTGKHCFTLDKTTSSPSTPADNVDAFYSHLTEDAGLMPSQFAVGNYVWLDYSRDGILGSNESFIPNTPVSLTNSDTNAVLQTTTDATGHYVFDRLLPGNYCIQVTVPVDYKVSPSGKDSIVDATGKHCFVLNQSTSRLAAPEDQVDSFYVRFLENAGLMPPQFAVGEYVWEDSNRDGVHDASEKPLANIPITLTGPMGLTRSMNTDDNGYYTFDDLPPGNYSIHFGVPSDYTASPLGEDSVISPTGDYSFLLDQTTATKAPPNHVDAFYDLHGVDAGMMPPQFAVGDMVWDDFNRDGVHDATELPIANITVQLSFDTPDGTGLLSTTTDKDGHYLFDQLDAGDYCLHFGIPADSKASPMGKDSVIDSTGDHCFTLNKTTTTPSVPADNVKAFYKNLDEDAGIMPPQFAVGDNVWNDVNRDGVHDPTELPLANITVTLTQPDGTPVTSTTTNKDGHYIFDQLPPGNYCVQVSIPSDFTASPSGHDSLIDSTGKHCFTLDKTTTTPSTSADGVQAFYKNLNEDAGLMPPLFAVGDQVWDDFNRDGVHDASEQPLTNITVTLTHSTEMGTMSTSTQTDSTGHYIFDELSPGDYCVHFDIPADSKASPMGKDSVIDTTGDHCFTLNKTTTTPSVPADNVKAFYKNLDEDAGIMPPQFAVGDNVWNDFNRNGAKDSTEAPMPNITVVLTTPDGTPIKTTTTDSTGRYVFEELPPGNYCIQVSIPSDFTASPAGNDSMIDSTGKHCFTLDKTTTTPSTSADGVQAFYKNFNEDAGLMPPQFAVGDFVWNDFNRDGVHDASEQPLAGVVVELSFDSPSSVGFLVATTDSTGHYIFDELNPGKYCLQFTIPADSKASPTGKDSVIDATGKHCFNLDKTTTTPSTPADNIKSFYKNLDEDAGIMPPQFAVGDNVWSDVNSDGKRDPTEEPMKNITVALTQPDGTPISTTTTDSTGRYVFDNLNAGDYCVHVTIPKGFSASPMGTDSFIDNTGKHCFTLDKTTTTPSTSTDGVEAYYKNFNVDAGLMPPNYAVGRYVWLDLNRDGVHDATSEPFLSGITVKALLDGSVIATATTDANGHYTFDNLEKGDYVLEFSKPNENYTFSPLGHDSKTDASGKINVKLDIDTNPSVLVESEASDNVMAYYIDRNENVGIMQPRYPVEVLVYFFPNDTVIPNVPVTITTENPNVPPITVTPTNETGKVTFTDLPPGNYCVHIDLPYDTHYTSKDPNSLIKQDGKAYCFTINDTLVDPPIKVPVAVVANLYAIGSSVFLDLDGNGYLNAPGDKQFANITVKLSTSSGSPVKETQTDAYGTYHFDGLVSGDYVVQFVAPTDYTFPVKTDQSLPVFHSVDGKVPVSLNLASTVVVDSFDGTLNADYINRTVNSGLSPILFALGRKIFVDANNNGLMDATESSIAVPPIKLTLTTADGKPVTTVQPANGDYLVNNLSSGNYCLHLDVPVNYNVSSNKGTTFFNQFDAAGNVCFTLSKASPNVVCSATDAFSDCKDLTENAGLVPTYAVSGNVWKDMNNDEARQPADMVLPGQPLALLDSTGAQVATTTTDSQGNYLFNKLPAGIYTLKFVAPNDTLIITPSPVDSVFPKTGVLPIQLSPTTTSVNPKYDGLDPTQTPFILLHKDVGVSNPLYAIGDMVYIDKNLNGVSDVNETGVANIKVTLVTASSNTTIATTLTDSSGHYLFDSLPTGNYCVQFELSPDQIPVNPLSKQICRVVDPTHTDMVSVSTTPLVGKISAAWVNLNMDQGIRVAIYCISSTVWSDNGNGLVDSIDMTMSNVTVELFKDGVLLLRTRSTDLGLYVFDTLEPGSYMLHIFAPPGTLLSPQTYQNKFNATGYYYFILGYTNVDAHIDPNGNDTGCDMVIDSYSAMVSQAVYALGNFTFIDYNENGIRDPDEPPLGGVNINAFDARLPDSIAVSYQSESNGFYVLDSLLRGQYCVIFEGPGAYKLTKKGPDSVPNPATGSYCLYLNISTPNLRPTVREDRMDAQYILEHVDAGFVPMSLAIGSYVWYDSNGDGIINFTELPAPNTTVTLTNSKGEPARTIRGVIIPPTVTDAQGYYKFSDVMGGMDYTLNFGIPTTAPKGSVWTVLANNNSVTPSGEIKILNSSYIPVKGSINSYSSLYNNGGIFPPCFVVGTRAWADGNANGFFDVNEIAYANATVTLYNEDGTRAMSVDKTILPPGTTSSNGNYRIIGIPPGRYYAVLTIPPRYIVSNVLPGGSQFDPNTKRTPVFTLAIDAASIVPTYQNTTTVCKYMNPTINAGIITPRIAIGGHIYYEPNPVSNATVPFPNATVVLTTPTGSLRLETTTDSKGFYLFDGLAVSQYAVSLTIPPGFLIDVNHTQNRGTSKGQVGPINLFIDAPEVVPTNSTSYTGVLAPYINPNIDMVLKQSVLGVQGIVWRDLFNNNGFFVANSSMPVFVNVTLYSGKGAYVASVLADPVTGRYSFPNLGGGMYSVMFTPTIDPTSWVSVKVNSTLVNNSTRLLASSILTNFSTPIFTLDSMNPELTPCVFADYFCLQENAGFKRPDNGSINGRVFKDFNCNGKFDNATTFYAARDLPLAGIPVYLYVNDTATPLASTLTLPDGSYQFLNLTFGNNYLVSTGTPNLAISSARQVQACSGTEYNTVIIKTPSTINFGFITDEEYCVDNPDLTTSCYVLGRAVGGTYSTNPIVVSFPYNATAHSQIKPNAIYNQVGTVHGLAYDRSNAQIYASAFLKVNTDYGPSGSGAIYKIDKKTNAVSKWMSVNDIWGAIYAGETPADDPQEFDFRTFAVYKTSLSDIDIDPEKRQLGVCVLSVDFLHLIPLDVKPTSLNSRRVAIPNNCAARTGDMVPFAVTFHLGKWYVGCTCTAEITSTLKDLIGYVTSYNPATSLWTTVLTVPFNYTRGCRNTDQGLSCVEATWQPWITDENIPQPLLSGIAFDGNDMVISVRDREGDMGHTISAPDILRACANAQGVLVLEKNGRCGTLIGSHLGPSGTQGQVEGPGTGEFYNDNFKIGPNAHDDTGGLSVYQVPGYPNVVSNSYDVDGLWEGATKFYNNTNGAMGRGFVLYVTPIVDPTTQPTFGKSNGLGDIVATCPPKQISLGSRVWTDTNLNGYAEAQELGKPSVTLQLINAAGTVVQTTTTNARGYYQFVNVPPKDTYSIVAVGQTCTVIPPPTTGRFVSASNKGTTVAASKCQITGIVIPDAMLANNVFNYDFGVI